MGPKGGLIFAYANRSDKTGDICPPVRTQITCASLRPDPSRGTMCRATADQMPRSKQRRPRPTTAARSARSTARKAKGVPRPRDSSQSTQRLLPSTETPTHSSGLLPIRLWEGSTVGSLLMDVPAIQEVIAEGLRAEGVEPAGPGYVAHFMLRELAAHVERRLNMEVLLYPLCAAYLSRWQDRPDLPEKAFDGVLSFLDEQPAQVQAEVFSVPAVSWVTEQIRRHGSPTQRRVLERLLARAARGRRGQPKKAIESRADVYYAECVAEVEKRLGPVFDYIRERKRAGGFQSDHDEIRDGLAKKGYLPPVINAALKSHTPSGAASQLVASRFDMKPSSVRAMAARGRNFLQRTSRSR